MRIKRSIVTGAAAVFILLSLISVFIMHLYSIDSVNMENALFLEKDKLKDDMIYLESLLESDHSIVHNEKGDFIYEKERVFSPEYHRALVENMAHNMGVEVAIYIKENNSFHCITSSITDQDGKPALDVYLGEESAAYASIQSGEDYTGKDVILGSDYLTLYRPLFQPDTNEVMGILFTGIKINSVKSMISRRSSEMSMHIILIRVCAIVLGTLLIVILITILVRIIAEKNIAEMRLQVIFDAMPLGANIHGKDLSDFDCNESVVKMFGLSSKQEYIDNFHKLSPEYQPDGSLSKEKMFDLLDKAYINGFDRFEWMHQTLNGEPIPCEVTLVRIKHKNEYNISVYLRDLRDIKTAITQKNESEKSLAIMTKILNGINAIIYVTVPETGEILFINDYLKNMFKIKEDCVGQYCYKLFEGRDTKCDFCPTSQIEKEPNNTIVWERFNPVTNRIYRNTTRFIEWYDGRTVQIQHSVDMTDLVNAKEQAEQSSRFKTQFLSRMSHEIRTPMNAILGITEIQLQDETLQPSQKEAMDKIFNSGYLLLGIINDILDLSKIEAGKLELTPASYDIPSLINDTVQITVMHYNNKQIEFKLDVDEKIPLMLFGDELRIRQILNNLLSNAFKYTDKGEITMSVKAEDSRKEGDVILVFTVADTGQGMTKKQVEKLFDEYSRFNLEANRTTEGTGLGMNITNHLVHMMNGEISVESEPGKGSAFTVRLPQKIIGNKVIGMEIAENIKHFNAGIANQSNKAPQFVREYMPYGRVLVVDDVETNLYVARGLMAPYGLSIEIASSGPDAIEKIKNGADYDIIFMDHFMPKMDGIETTKIIRGMGYTRPIIALTANAMIGQAEMFTENGFDGFISKPIDIRQLNNSLNKLIRDKFPPEVVEAARQQAAKILAKTSFDGEQPSSDRELAALFVRDAEKSYAILKTIITNAFRRDDDFRQYVVNIHAMKSALANVGEEDLSSMAYKLELAGRAENLSLIMSETPAFLKTLGGIIEKNKLNAASSAAVNESEDMSYLAEKLRIIKAACEDYDDVTANKTMSELKQKTWTKFSNALIESIDEHLLHSDFDEAAKLIEDFEIATSRGNK